MTLLELARKLRPYIEQAAQSLDDESAVEAVQLFPAWRADATYRTGDRVQRNGTLCKCLQGHVAQADWAPELAPSLWAKVLTVEGEILPWERPDSTNTYSIGDQVTHNGKTWESTENNNSWEPGVYGWVEVV